MTFSIAARCPETGMLGVAVATSNPCVGSRCSFVRAGVGAALTQHRTDPRLGPAMLDALETGADAAEAVAKAAAHPHAGWRQLACVDARGATAFHHGEKIDSIHGAAEGEGAVAIGNLLRDARVPAAMLKAFAAGGGFVERLLEALDGGLAAGGEELPLASAALLVARREPFPYVDLRVDLDDAPLAALRHVWEAYADEAPLFVTRALAPEEIE